jgi:hypothetical protein
VIQALLQESHQRRQDDSLNSTLDSSFQAAMNDALMILQGVDSAESGQRQAIDSVFQMQLDSVFQSQLAEEIARTNADSLHHAADSVNLAIVIDALNNLQNADSAEHSERSLLDSIIQAQIDTVIQQQLTEAAERASQDSLLGVSIQEIIEQLHQMDSTEAANRAAADSVLQESIAEEAASRITGDSALQVALAAETAARIAATPQVAYQAGLQLPVAIPNGALTTVIYDNASFNDGGGYNSSTGIFTAPANGRYHFDASVMWQAVVPGPQYTVQLSVNGMVKKMNYNTFNFGQDFMQMLTIELALNAGDQVKISVQHNSGAPKNLLGGLVASTFNGHQLY